VGNGPGLKPPFQGYGSNESVVVDTAGGVLTEDILEAAMNAALANFGKPDPNNFIFMGSFTTSYAPNPQYEGTPWRDKDRLTKREHAVAKLHTTLKKLGALRGVDEQAFEEIQKKSIKRLKQAKWAQKKVQSSP
jgi:hypothetical protein